MLEGARMMPPIPYPIAKTTADSNLSRSKSILRKKNPMSVGTMKMRIE